MKTESALNRLSGRTAYHNPLKSFAILVGLLWFVFPLEIRAQIRTFILTETNQILRIELKTNEVAEVLFHANIYKFRFIINGVATSMKITAFPTPSAQDELKLPVIAGPAIMIVEAAIDTSFISSYLAGICTIRFFTQSGQLPSGGTVGTVEFAVGPSTPDLVFQDIDGFLATGFIDKAGVLSTGFLTPDHPGDKNWKVVGSGRFNTQFGPFRHDLIFQHADGTLAFWYLDGGTLEASVLLDSPNSSDPSWRVAAAGDFGVNSSTDLLFQHDDGSLAVWFLNGVSLWSTSMLNPSRPGDANWKVIGAADLNDDRKHDLVFQHTDGTLAVWFLDGINLVSATLLNPSNPGDARWRAVSVTDANRDRKPDLVFQHQGDSSLAVWLLDGIKLISVQQYNAPFEGGTWKVVAP